MRTATAPERCARAADDPGFVAVLHGEVDDFRASPAGVNTDVQRINYDTGLNGRLTVNGYGGDDFFFSDDTTVMMTFDGGAGDDFFQVGQVFGDKRNAPNVRASDTFPRLVATTRGWLSAGASAPLVIHGGTGDDDFVVYSKPGRAAGSRVMTTTTASPCGPSPWPPRVTPMSPVTARARWPTSPLPPTR